MSFAAPRYRSSLTRRVLGALMAFCLATAPMLSMASDLHELSHGVEHLQRNMPLPIPTMRRNREGFSPFYMACIAAAIASAFFPTSFH